MGSPHSRLVVAGLATCVLATAWPADAAVFTVNSVQDLADNGPGNGSCWTGGVVFTGGTPSLVLECTLRAAIEEANASAGDDRLVFAPFIATDGGGWVRIAPSSPLPAVTETLEIDGTTAPGYDTGDPEQPPVVQIDGNAVADDGLQLVLGHGSALHGLAVYGFAGDGIQIFSDDNVVQGCHVGIWNGAFVDGNGGDGIRLTAGAERNTIGPACGPEPEGCSGRLNVVSGNFGDGVEDGGLSNRIAGNRIGTRADGLGIVAGVTPTGNFGWGVFLDRVGPQQSRVGDVGFAAGGVAVPAGNLISGNVEGGILVQASEDTVLANRIGTALNGTSNAGNAGPGVELRGATNVVGDASGATSNVIAWNEGSGVVIDGPTGVEADNQVLHNRIGTDAGSTLALPNDVHGVHLKSGTDARIEGNVISANLGNGVRGGVPGTVVVGNVIGTNGAGGCLGNGQWGVWVEAGGWSIGRVPAQGGGNEIGCNQIGGVFGDESAGTVLEGNHIGTDPSGNDLGNGEYGIYVEGVASSATIGGTLGSDASNTIGFNEAGVGIFHGFASVRGNYIGTDAGGSDLGNDLYGVVVVDAVGSRIGGSSAGAGEGNEIAWNGDAGVTISEVVGTTLRNQVRFNSFHDNDGLGIDIAPLGFNANDPGDFDEGPNRLMNSPELGFKASYDEQADLVTIAVRVFSGATTAAYPLRIDFYIPDDGTTQGETWVGEALYTNPGATELLSFTPATAFSVGTVLVATTTDSDTPQGSTSEFSGGIAVPEPGTSLGLGAGALLLRALAGRRRGRPGAT